MRDYFAHTHPSGNWEKLEIHLQEVADLSKTFAQAFDAAEWGYLAGLWHDLGKYSGEFQEYLARAGTVADPHAQDVEATANAKVDHSSAGAQHASEMLGEFGPLMAYIIAGHHAGLADGADLRLRLAKVIPQWKDHCPDRAKAGALGGMPLKAIQDAPPVGFRIALFLRMVFSSLVDADFLCTEGFMAGDRAAQRPQWPPDIQERMLNGLEEKLQSFGPPRSPVDEQRLQVQMACRSAADQGPGFYELTVPTGGGKTLSSLLFGLSHARRNQQRRVIYAIPYTSIIEQNAEVFRETFAALERELGMDVVLEHHSNLQPEKETTTNRLAAENWDAPLVVTTNVQLFESLFASRTSSCRKLHNLAHSVIILDEAQALSSGMLSPILATLRCLVYDFGCTVVFCTATQPALKKREGFLPGIPPGEVYQIIPNAPALYESLRRVRVDLTGPLDNPALSNRLESETGGALVVVNTTKSAQELYETLPPNWPKYHLSARMCPEHRTAVLYEIKARQAQKQCSYLISTQLIEAGVDISFPAVYRAECGLDSLAQAAGRCNRNGELKDPSGQSVLGRVHSFQHEGHGIPQILVDLRDAANHAGQIQVTHGEDLLSLSALEAYFRLHIWAVGQRKHLSPWDDVRVMECFGEPGFADWQYGLAFRKAAELFRLIPDATHPVVIPYGAAGKKLCEELRERHRRGIPPYRQLYRRAQRYIVQVYQKEWQELLNSGDIEPLFDGAFHVLVHPEGRYDEQFGLRRPDDEIPAGSLQI